MYAFLVDLYSKLTNFTDPNYDIYELDIAVTAVATAPRDFFKRFPSIFSSEQMSEMEEISSKFPFVPSRQQLPVVFYPARF